jgi:hypothetical protein
LRFAMKIHITGWTGLVEARSAVTRPKMPNDTAQQRRPR